MSATLERRMAGKPPLIDPVLSFDPGPSMRQRPDGTLISIGPGAVELEDRSEPGRDTRIRGAHRANVLDDLHARHVITKRQHDAAVRFLDDCSLASGGGMVADFMAVRSPPGPRSGLPEVQTDAIGRVNQVIRLLGLNDGTVFWWVVFKDRRLGEYDAKETQREGTAARMFRDALTALDEHYGKTDDRRRSHD
jgi:hypothetical protein